MTSATRIPTGRLVPALGSRGGRDGVVDWRGCGGLMIERLIELGPLCDGPSEGGQRANSATLHDSPGDAQLTVKAMVIKWLQ
jgi:hypothetical protein